MPLIGRKKVDEALNKMVQKKNKQVRAVAIQTFQDIAFRTPVDTGRARKGWLLSMGTPNLAGKGGGITQARKVPKFILGKTVYFSNGVEYIETLERGRRLRKRTKRESKGSALVEVGSKQAPRGMVRIALRNAQKRLRQL